MRSLYAAAVLALGTSLTGCAATTTTSKVAVDYNRFFAQSRDEVLVTNILRASAREPLEFSTMGTVTGSVRNSGSITIPFTNLIGGGKDGLTISPSATLNDGINPNVTIVPLADKEFTSGILKPVSIDTLGFFLNQGWDPELVLMLSVGGLICEKNGSKTLVLNRGDRHFETDANGKTKLVTPSRYDKFAQMFGYVPRLPIQSTDDTKEAEVTMPAKEALALLKDGIGKDRKIAKVEAIGKGSANVMLTIVKPNGSELIGLNPTEVCKEPGTPVTGKIKEDQTIIPVAPVSAEWLKSHPLAEPPPKAYAVLRSVESIIYFLGETQRDRWEHEGCGPMSDGSNKWPYYERRRPTDDDKGKSLDQVAPSKLILLRIDKTCSSVPRPFRTFVKTKFNDQYYYILKSGDAANDDRTLTTITFLNELIALQTSESTITSSTPVVAIESK